MSSKPSKASASEAFVDESKVKESPRERLKTMARDFPIIDGSLSAGSFCERSVLRPHVQLLLLAFRVRSLARTCSFAAGEAGGLWKSA